MARVKRRAEWQAAIRDAWLRDHPGKTVADYEIAGTCSDTVEGERACRKWVDEWHAREGNAIHRRLSDLAPALPVDPAAQSLKDETNKFYREIVRVIDNFEQKFALWFAAHEAELEQEAKGCLHDVFMLTGDD